MAYERGLVLFRRDLRLADHAALRRAAAECREILCAFVFDPRQARGHTYFTRFGFEFLLGSLKDLDRRVARRGGRLCFFRGLPDEVCARLVREAKVEAVYAHRDFTPFSTRRDEAIARALDGFRVPFRLEEGVCLRPPGSVRTLRGEPYSVFSPFFKKATAFPLPPPEKTPPLRLYRGRVPFEIDVDFGAAESGGRTRAERILSRLDRFRRYDRSRDDLSGKGTTGLSPHLKFGTVSAREAYAAVRKTLGPRHPLLRQLYWRDFFTHLAAQFPHVFGRSFRQEFDRVAWDKDEARLGAWKEGRTGFPLVDAAMRQLAATGKMPNRARMAVSSFLSKDLHIHWGEGERHFATLLEDYDPCVNNGNWQWAASTGADAQPYFRIFNPWTQQRRFDADATYVKRWVPELARLAPREIHALARERPERLAYPPPIVDHAVEREEAKRRFREARKRG